MIRALLVLAAAALALVTVSAVIGQPGRASLEWLGWRIDMTAAAAVLLLVAGALIATAFWRTVIWIAEAPMRAQEARRRARRRNGAEAMTRGFLAAAAGDGAEARRWSAKTTELVDDSPALVRLLAAQAAEAAGDPAAARGAYAAMLAFQDMRLAGRRGLMQLALERGDGVEALEHAEAAYAVGRPPLWAWRAVLQARLDAADWSRALELVKSAQDRKLAPQDQLERTRAATLAALAAGQDAGVDPKARAEALGAALEAARLKPGFAPGVVMAARLLAADGKTGRAEGLIQAAWKAAPHPALWLAWRDLVTQETPKQRAGRLRALAGLNPDSRESRLLMLEAALTAGEALAAREAAAALKPEPLTARICALMARTAFAAGNPDEARAFIARAAAAPQEPDWSDLDPEGKAFAYTPQDWARLVATYGETGELVHPRLERRERTLAELPELPMGYQASAPFLRAAEAAGAAPPLPDDPGPLEPEAPAAAEPPAKGRRLGARLRRR